ncbi:MAG: hypothetical protein E7297_02225 [Lachnospiraceae bacterium]|nr:hypothetical protein [Lachnospiraceae bacterium]
MDTQKEKNGNPRVRLKTSIHAKQEKQEFACQGENKHTRKTRKTGICVSGRKQPIHAKREKQESTCQAESNPYTQNKKNRNSRVDSKTSIHAKREKQRSACQTEKKLTRKTRKAEICVSKG